MMDASFVKAIQDASDTKLIATTGPEGKLIDVFTKPVHRVALPDEPSCIALESSTLGAVIQYYKDNSDDTDLAESMIVHIESHSSVKLMSTIRGLHRRRETYVHCKAHSPFESFNLGAYLSTVEFVPKLLSLFGPSDGRADLLRIFTKMTSENVRSDADDGLTQEVTIRKGVSLNENARVPNPVMLAPWRTFTEVAQPESAFVVRLKKAATPDDPPTIALFEADGGAWKVKAVDNIRGFLRTQLGEAAVIIG